MQHAVLVTYARGNIEIHGGFDNLMLASAWAHAYPIWNNTPGVDLDQQVISAIPMPMLAPVSLAEIAVASS